MQKACNEINENIQECLAQRMSSGLILMLFKLFSYTAKFTISNIHLYIEEIIQKKRGDR